MNKIEILQKLINVSNNIVVMTGAGFSKASGIPDFRSADGLYNDKNKSMISPEEILSHHYFMAHPKAFYDFYFDKMIYPNAMPNAGHYKLVELEKCGKLKAIITQNIDGLHQKAGSKNVLELHGSVLRNHCMKCHTFYSLDDLINNKQMTACPICGGLIKPDVVLYEEGLDMTTLNEAIKAVVNADLLLIIASSMLVNPAASLPYYYRGNKMVIINLEPTPLDSYATLIINEKCEEVLSQIKVKE
ncbi:MAG: NAD-dependent protein deacylase [Mollicutes bacterium]|nr:NAD-dependent protein deacylase [Mollicutes bacterium]